MRYNIMKKEQTRKQIRKARKQQKKQRKQKHQQFISKKKTEQFIKKVKSHKKSSSLKSRSNQNLQSSHYPEQFMQNQDIPINFNHQEGQQIEDQQQYDQNLLLDDNQMMQYDGYIDQLGDEEYNNNEMMDEDGQMDSQQMKIHELEQKLGMGKKISKNTKYEKLAKGFGFDDDLFSFLDNISKKVKEPVKTKESKKEKVKKQKNNQKTSQKVVSKSKKVNKVNKIEKVSQNALNQKINQEQIISQPSQNSIKIKKSMNGLFNRISDGNLTITLRQFINIFENYPKVQTVPIFASLFTKFNLLVQKPLTHILTANIVIAVAMTMIYGSRIMALIIKQLTNAYLNLDHEIEDDEQVRQIGYSKLFQKKKNYVTIICYFYEFQVISADFIYSFISGLVIKNSELEVSAQKVEYLYIILQKNGQKLRNNDTSVLKSILDLMKKIIEKSKQLNLYETTKIKFIQIQINEIKFNRKSVFDADQRMGFLHTFLKKVVTAQAPIIQNKQYMMLLTYQQITDADTTLPHWWEAITAGNNLNTLQLDDQAKVIIPQTEQIKQLKQLAKRYHFVTQIRRNIFIELMSAKDYIEATHKILQLKVKRLQEIATVIVESNVRQPNTFNPFYALVASKICAQIPKFRVSLQFALWDRMKQVEDYGREEQDIRKISNLGKFMGWVLASKSANCSLSMLKYFTDLNNLSVYQNVFVKIMFKQLLRKADKESLIKLISKLKQGKNKGIMINIKEYLDDLVSQYDVAVKQHRKNIDLLKSLKFMRRMILIQQNQEIQMDN